MFFIKYSFQKVVLIPATICFQDTNFAQKFCILLAPDFNNK